MRISFKDPIVTSERFLNQINDLRPTKYFKLETKVFPVCHWPPHSRASAYVCFPLLASARMGMARSLGWLSKWFAIWTLGVYHRSLLTVMSFFRKMKNVMRINALIRKGVITSLSSNEHPTINHKLVELSASWDQGGRPTAPTSAPAGRWSNWVHEAGNVRL
jgi:hypothetical protein